VDEGCWLVDVLVDGDWAVTLLLLSLPPQPAIARAATGTTRAKENRVLALRDIDVSSREGSA
jgi:hypothetical protein